VSGIRVIPHTRRVEIRDESIELTGREYELLQAFLRKPNAVLTRAELLAEVWGLSFDPGTNIVDVYVGYLRRKLGADRIETVRYVGYRLCSDCG
jgi:two-component system, OmpR family, copper resistance phosphate regulon response regulator CusR